MLPQVESLVKTYRAAGCPIFPLHKKSKVPTTPNGVKDATLDADAYKERFMTGCNVGLATGYACDVIDLDGLEAVRGFASLLNRFTDYTSATLEECCELFEQRIGPVSLTGKGAHIFCLPSPERTNQTKLLTFGDDSIDYRGRGGYVVVPPSIHPSGRLYKWFKGFRMPTAPAPACLPARRSKEQLDLEQGVSFDEDSQGVLDFSAAKEAQQASAYQEKVLQSNIETLRLARTGERNSTLNTCAFNIGQVVGGDEAFERRAQVELYNAGVEIGLSSHEIAATIKSAFTGGKAKPKEFDRAPASSKASKASAASSASKKLLLPDLVALLESDPEFAGLLGYDLLAQRIVKLRAQDDEAKSRATARYWSDYDSNLLASRLAERLEKNVPAQMLEQALDIVAHHDERHPVRDYLYKCSREWDGRSRISEALVALGAELIKPHRLALAIWLAGAAARGCAFDVEVKFDSMLVLEGPQGCGKSTVVSILGGEWAADTAFNLDSKDAYQQLGNAWVHEWAEMAAVLKSTPERVKAFLSKSADDFREAYARRQTHAIRHCAFIGTTNEDDYLRDDTGNRRYWPVACCQTRSMIDLEWLRANRDQLWGEAMQLRYSYEQRGSGFAPMGDEVAIMNAYVQTRQQADELRDVVTNEIIRRFQTQGAGLNGSLDVEVFELMNSNEIKKEPTLSKLRLRRILKEIGGHEVRVATKTVRTCDGALDFGGATNASGRIRKFRFDHQPHSRDDFDDAAFGEIQIPTENR